MSDDQNAVIGILNNLQRDTSQIKTDLAVNTTKTGYIEEHLRTLNGKVLKQEEKQQQADKERDALKEDVAVLLTSKRRWNDGWLGVLKQFGLFALGLISAFIISRYF
jgi:hypothetical protein